LLVAAGSTTLILYIALGTVLGRVLGDTSYGQLALFNEVVRLVLDAYVEPVNLDRAMAGAEFGMVDSLDGESAYLDAAAFRALQTPQREPLADVGVVLSRRFSFLAVVATRPGSPAEKGGVKAGDLIKTIDDRHTRLLGVPVGEALLRGAPGSSVKLKLLRPGSDAIDVSLVRERLLHSAPRGRMLEGGAGYLSVPEFGPRAAEEVQGELDLLRRQGARSLVLDLRRSAFGAPDAGIKVAELFVNGGVVARLSGRRVREQVFTADPARSAWKLPLAVLVDSSTAGPAEVVAAALLDSGRAPVVGESTFGRAPVQKTIPLPEGGLVLTVAKYVTPKGKPIHNQGLEPSVAVNAPPDAGEGAEGDPILDKALELLRGEAKKAA
jgi:carboxyl-terminal processing protease